MSECLSNVNSVAQLFSDEYHRKQKLVQCLCTLVILYPWSVNPFLLHIFCSNSGTDRQRDPTSFFRSGHFFSRYLCQAAWLGHTLFFELFDDVVGSKLEEETVEDKVWKFFTKIILEA